MYIATVWWACDIPFSRSFFVQPAVWCWRSINCRDGTWQPIFKSLHPDDGVGWCIQNSSSQVHSKYYSWLYFGSQIIAGLFIWNTDFDSGEHIGYAWTWQLTIFSDIITSELCWKDSEISSHCAWLVIHSVSTDNWLREETFLGSWM